MPLDTLIVIHLGGEYERFHRRHFYQALAGALPDGWAMVCVNRPVTMDLIARRSPQHWLSALRHRQPRQLNKSLFLYTPFQPTHELVADRLPGLRAVNRLFLYRQLSRAISGLFGEEQRIISWVSHPIQSWVWDLFPSEMRVYECYDDYSRTPRGSLLPRLWPKEQECLGRADAAFFASELLMHNRTAFARKARHVPNGVPAFLIDRLAEHARHEPVHSVTRIGYLGNFYSFMATALLHELCRNNPQWQFVFAGPVKRKPAIDDLSRLPNVSFLGPLSYDDVPRFLLSLDVALIPFELTEYVRATNPLKTYEYMAAGVPIVASNLPELQRFRDIIRIVENTPAAFGQAIAETLADNRAALSLKLTTRAREYTWERISREVVVPELLQLVE